MIPPVARVGMECITAKLLLSVFASILRNCDIWYEKVKVLDVVASEMGTKYATTELTGCCWDGSIAILISALVRV